MIIKTMQKILQLGWDHHSRRESLKKFKMYGDYKKMYNWPVYENLRLHLNLFRKLSSKVSDEWYKYFTLIRQIEDINYVPEDIWHIYIEPVLNKRSYAKANNNKSFFHLQSYAHLFPIAFLHCIEGVYYDANFKTIPNKKLIDYLPTGTPLVVKKSIDSGGGKGVQFFENREEIEFKKIENTIGLNFVIQEKVVQHEWFALLNQSSINTIRVMTYRSVKDERVHVLQCVLRMGKSGSQVDNQSSGGIACGIDKTGVLNHWATDKLSNKFYSVNGLEFSKLGNVPQYEKLLETCKEIAAQKFNERILVFDTWRDENSNIRLLEINNINIGIEDIQKNNGPLFGDFTEEIIEYCAKNKRNFCFDFDL